MVAEVNKIIAGELLNHRSVVIPGVGTLYVAHRGARRLSRQKIAAPRNEIDFRPSEEGVSLVELIRRAAGCDEAQAQAVFGRWLAKTREGEVLTLEGIGILRHRAFTSEPAFAAQLNPAGEEVVTLQPRMNRAVVAIAVAAIVVAVAVFGYIEFAPKSVSRFAAQAEKSNVERPKASSGSAEDGVSAAAVVTGGERSTEESAAGPDGAAGPDRPTVATASAEIPQAVSAQPTVATASTEVPQTTSARPAAVPQPASERMQSGWCYVVFGVFSTEENAARCREQLLREAPSLAVGVYPFGAKYMVSPFAAQDRGVCERFAREHRSAWPDLWIYAKK
uniref:SPOR domain-containing protein n=1 Tax=Alistipes communis TaxID=2585118 RepID=UPI003FD70FE3